MTLTRLVSSAVLSAIDYSANKTLIDDIKL